ncbi:hypothetical protein LPJ64_006079 [Coemansia asiatica]|uniref:COPI associated protein n=1 Tax=Coemansia asiatica TaxID=1052880 RepID=A0A9W7XFZ1_9FUNG|nr:hypothetical protein LPJ64_006079 [Coemansia asiatica]
MGYINRYLLLLAFNVLNILAFGVIVSVAIVNIVDHKAPTNLIIYYAYTGVLSLSLMLSELRIPRLLNSQARFLFSYTGRGIVLTYFGCIVYTNKLYGVIACAYTVSLGVLYMVVAWLPFVPLQHGILYNWSRWCREGSSQFYAGKHGDREIRESRSKGLMAEQSTLGLAFSSDAARIVERPADVLNSRLASSAAANGLNLAYGQCESSQSMQWLESLPKMASSVERAAAAAAAAAATAAVPFSIARRLSSGAGAAGSAHSALRGSPSGSGGTNDSFVYGLTMGTKRPQTTGDEYLDGIVNSSRFAQEMVENNDQGIVVRDLDSPARPYSSGLGSEVSDMPRPYSTASAASQPHAFSPASPLPHVRISSPMPYLVFAPESRESLNENMMHVTQALDSDQAVFYNYQLPHTNTPSNCSRAHL